MEAKNGHRMKWDNQDHANQAYKKVLKGYTDLSFRHLAETMKIQCKLYPEGKKMQRSRVHQTSACLKNLVYRELMIEDNIAGLIDNNDELTASVISLANNPQDMTNQINMIDHG